MTYTVAITSQGQMSIPATIRKLLGFSQPGTAVARIVDNRMIVEPVIDIFSLEGGLRNRLPKKYRGKTTEELTALQKETVTQAYANRYKKSLR